MIVLCIILKNFLINLPTFNHFTLFVDWSIIWKENLKWLYQAQDQLNYIRRASWRRVKNYIPKKH